MHRRTRTSAQALRATAAAAWIACPWAAPAQAGSTGATPDAAAEVRTLRQAVDAAWARQPDAMALPARRDAARAQQSAARAWTPEPAALELSNRTDRLSRNQGAREVEVGVAVPIWLPGERDRSAALADAEGAAVESRAAEARLRVAGLAREAWWQWQRARVELAMARERVENASRIAADVARRTKAGELARADQHQADGAVAAAQASAAQAEAGLATARQQLRALTGREPVSHDTAEAAEEPPVAEAAAGAEIEAHAAMQALKDRAAAAERAAALATAQSRAHPELMLAATRERGALGEASQQTITLGVRIPLGNGPQHQARIASARAEAAELQALKALERDRLIAEREAAKARVEAARGQLAAAEQRATLARETRGFFEKSFRLGETDLPTRLRIDAEAAEAERQAALGRIEQAAAISAWRQALGLLPP